MSRSIDVPQPEAGGAPHGMSGAPTAGLVQPAVSVVLLSSAWPLTKIALQPGSTPLWFAEGRMVISDVTIATALILRRTCWLPHRADLPALMAVGMVSSVGFLMTPAVSLMLASLLLGEAATPDLPFGAALIIGGVGAAACPDGRP